MEKKSVVIYVAGQRFALSTEDSEEYIIALGEKVESMINSLTKANSRLNRDGAATLSALTILDEKIKLEEKLEKLSEQLKAYLKDADSLREENDSLKAEIEKLKAEKTAPAAAEKAPAHAESPEPQKAEESRRQLAFAGKDMRGDKKKRHNHEEKRAQANKPWTQQEKKPLAVELTPAAAADEKGLPEEPPMQYSIFDADFI